MYVKECWQERQYRSSPGKEEVEEEEEEEEEEEDSEMAIFNFARHIRKLCFCSDVLHSFDGESAREHDGGV